MRVQVTQNRLLELLEENRALREELDTLRAEKFARRERDLVRHVQGASRELLTPMAAMAKVGGYKTQDSFLRMARRKGIPRVVVNGRVIRFESAALDAWLRRRAV